jgi:hypothetical protein
MEKKCFITFGEVNKKWLLYLAIIIISILKIVSENVEKENNFYFYLFIKFLALFFNGVIIAIYLIKDKILGKKNYLFSDEIIDNKENKEEGNYLSEKQKIEKSKNQEKLNKKSDGIKWLFISSLIYAIYLILYSFLKTTDSYKNRGGSLISLPFLIRIIIIIKLSNKLIKYIKIYKHHYVSIIAIIILILIINIFGFILGENPNLKGIFNAFFVNIFISLNCVFGAVYLNKSKGNALLLCFCTSIFLFILIILFHFINLIIHDCKFQNFDVQNENYDEYNNEFCKNAEFRNFYDEFYKFKNLNTYFYMFLTYLKEIIIWYIIYFFSPNHFGQLVLLKPFLLLL